MEFHEVSLKNISLETVTIELISQNGIQAKVQGSLSCLNCLQQLLRGYMLQISHTTRIFVCS